MIKTLSIKDFIIIDELKLDFDKGFNVITGETGAGKSIIINAIDLAFGARAGKDLIKTGKQRAVIELVLEADEKFPVSFYDEYGIENLGSEIYISREITESGTRSRINGVLVTQDVIKSLREAVIDINNQHMTYTYIQQKYHILLLDGYGDEEHKQKLFKYKDTYTQYSEVLKRLENAKNASNQSQQQVDFLKFQINEIANAQIENPEEDKRLNEELNVLANCERLKEHTYSAYWAMYGDDMNILSALGKVKTSVSKAAEMDTKLVEIESELINTQETLRELATQLRSYSESLELDEQKLDEIQQRLDTLDKLKRKYGNTLEDVLNTYTRLEQEYNSIEFSHEEIERLEKQKIELEKELQDNAAELSLSRKNIAKSLSELIRHELEHLDMPKVQFEIAVTPCEYNANGNDYVEFLISTNISETPKPLAKIASGGEISRVMLAIKTIFADSDNINTIIFDEIDTGISGNACQSVAQTIMKLAKSHQIISITHQPIIAAKSDRHFYVAKTQDEATSVKVYTLSEADKIKAIAVLASGEVTQDSMNFAKQLIHGNS